MKKRLFSILLSLCMVVTMIPMAGGAVFAAAANTVEIGGVTLSATDGLYYHNGADGAAGTVDNNSDEANAVFDPVSGTLTIDGLVVNGRVSAEVKGDLIVKLTGAESIINGRAANALRAYSGSLTITGAGTLTVKNGSNAYSTVYADDNITVNGGANVKAVKPGGGAQAMDANRGNIVISGAATKVVVSNNGVDENSNAIRANGGDGAITVSNGASLTALKTGDDTVKAVLGILSCDSASDSKVLIGNSTYHWHECNAHTTKINVKEHNISRNITEPATCTDSGKCDASCTVCGAELGEQTIDPKGHQFTEVAIDPATCTKDGVLAHQHCTACNKDFIDGVEKTADELKIAAKGHEFAKVEAKSATCTENGNNEYYACKNCDVAFKDAERTQPTTAADETIAATNHDFTGDYVSLGAESHARKCTKCDAYDENNATPHEFNGNTCALCGYTKSSGVHYKPTQKPEIIAGEGSKADLTLNGTKATITVEDGYEITDVILNGVSLGKVTEVTGLKTGDKVEIKTATVFNIGNYVKDLKLIARSSKTANKNVRVKVASVTDGNGNPVDLSVLKDKGYTVKYKFYRSEKKASEYGERIEKSIDNNSYLNNIGSKGTKYFYKVRVMVYDASGNLAAQTELNQCKYATRTWSK